MTTLEKLKDRYKTDPVPLEVVAQDFLGISSKEVAIRHHKAGTLGVRTFQLRDSRKAPWWVSLADLAVIIDRKRARG